jgi:hypothetical protein
MNLMSATGGTSCLYEHIKEGEEASILVQFRKNKTETRS